MQAYAPMKSQEKRKPCQRFVVPHRSYIYAGRWSRMALLGCRPPWLRLSPTEIQNKFIFFAAMPPRRWSQLLTNQCIRLSSWISVLEFF